MWVALFSVSAVLLFGIWLVSRYMDTVRSDERNEILKDGNADELKNVKDHNKRSWIIRTNAAIRERLRNRGESKP